ncbi:MAG TPA: penicillin acylase family protein, partial [Vicinamibacterales bacterium]|nr:penicillin acylase family protein [Vicinamibacterales bacterium]
MVAGAGLVGVRLRAQLTRSLPVLDGSVRAAGLSAPVTVARDALGIPAIRGRSREDVARATGFVHAQDRFFQMDLARRRAAGELAALVGPRALALDREIRRHRFRTVARRAVALMDSANRAILEAYTAGVNTGLAALAAPPFEYALLGQQPRPWAPEDTLLVVLSMFLILQDTDGSYEATLATMHDILPQPMFEFMASPGTEWDAPLVGPAFAVPPVPGPDVYDLRARRSGRRRLEAPVPGSRFPPSQSHNQPFDVPPPGDAGSWMAGVELGSNSFAVAGRLMAGGHPVIGNDMHLAVRVPNTWYRVLIEWGGDEAPGGRLIGLTLPGVPALVAGSNTWVAWGFTNTYADWGDIVLLELDPSDPTRYRTPHGWHRFERHDEVIEVAGQPPERTEVMWTIWGPVIGPDHRGRQRAYRWVAHDPERLARSIVPIESARSVEEAFDEANGAGAPGQNIVVADRSGRIGWSIYGSIPRRAGLDGRLPSSWSGGTRGWSGWLSPAEYPRIIDPPSGRIWTANARVVGGDMLSRLGDGGYEVGSRATMIRDRLLARERFTVRDLLDIQLDARALFLARWHDLLVRTLTPEALAGRPDRRQLRDIVTRTWTGSASPDSPAYRFTRMFRHQVSERVLAFVLAECYEADPAFDHTTLRRREGPVWKLVTERPLHLLDPLYDDWDDLLLTAVDAVIAQASREGSLARRTWSEYNVTAYRHPLSPNLPLLGRW